MTNQEKVIWPLEPHTRAKHAILTYYLRAWFTIQSRIPKRLLYIDGFAGPGEYEGGEVGSPILALQSALDQSFPARLSIPGMELNFIFIEEHGERFLNLQQKVNEIQLPNHFHVHMFNLTFENAMAKILVPLEDQGKKLAPSFIFIDPFGPTGFPMDLVHRIARHPGTELLINFSYQPLNQWFIQDPTKHPRLNELFGDQRWRPALGIANPADKEYFLVKEYKRALEERGWRGTSFRMINQHNQTQYHLLFGTTHYMGMLVMKRAMWSADPKGIFIYSDLSNPQQLRLFAATMDEDYSKELAQQIFLNRKGTSAKKQDIIESELAWHPTTIERHLTRALKILEYEKKPPRILSVAKVDGSKRKANSYPENCIITFSS